MIVIVAMASLVAVVAMIGMVATFIGRTSTEQAAVSLQSTSLEARGWNDVEEFQTMLKAFAQAFE